MKNEKTKNNLKKLQPYAVGLLLGLGITALVGLVGVSCSPHTTTPTASPLIIRKDALTAPTGYEYSYKRLDGDAFYTYGGINGESLVYFTRSVDGSFYNYSSGTFTPFQWPTGFSISMTFQHSNTIWGYHSNVDKYFPNDSNIGSDGSVGTVDKFKVILTNNTSHDFNFILDTSSMSTSFFWFNTNGVAFYHYQYNLGLNEYYIPAFSSCSITDDANSSSSYFDAFYLDDLGVSTAYTNGYNAGYSAGYSAGYDDGFDYGYVVGENDGEEDGYSAGYSAGYTLGYSEGSDFGYTQHELDGGIMGFIGRAFDTVQTFLNVEVFEGITLGALILWPLVLGVLFFMLKMFKSGD